MSSDERPAVGTIFWQDLTVENAEQVRDFYAAVVGWESRPEDMGGYDDFHMIAPATGESAAGSCHARGANAELPAQWLVYITVQSIDHSIAACVELGGALVDGPRPMGDGRFCVIRDPAGADCALRQPA